MGGPGPGVQGGRAWQRGLHERGHGCVLSCGQGEQELGATHENVQGSRQGRRNLILPEIDMAALRRRLINSG